MTTTNFIDGVTNVPDTYALGSYVMPDPTQFHTWFDDFDDYVAGQWLITEAGSGTRAVANADNGILVVTNGASDDNNNFLQWSGDTSASAIETWKFVAQRPLWFKCRFKVSDATQSDLVIGLQITDTSPLAVTDGVYFLKVDGSTTCNLLVTKNSTSTTTAAATIVSDTYVSLGFYYDGANAIYVFKDDVCVGQSALTNLPDDEELTISFGIQNGEAAAKSLSLDYIFVSKQR